MEKINSAVKVALESKDDSLHKIGIALEGIAKTIKSAAEKIKESGSEEEARNDLIIWYYKGSIDGSLQAFKAIVVCSRLVDTPEGAAVLKVDPKEVEEDA